MNHPPFLKAPSCCDPDSQGFRGVDRPWCWRMACLHAGKERLQLGLKRIFESIHEEVKMVFLGAAFSIVAYGAFTFGVDHQFTVFSEYFGYNVVAVDSSARILDYPECSVLKS